MVFRLQEMSWYLSQKNLTTLCCRIITSMSTRPLVSIIQHMICAVTKTHSILLGLAWDATLWFHPMKMPMTMDPIHLVHTCSRHLPHQYLLLRIQQKWKFQFLTVWWFGEEPGWLGGACHLWLNKVGYVLEEDPEAFDFLDPLEVLCACHLIPAFVEGKTTSLLGPSIAWDGKDSDWVNYCVMWWASVINHQFVEFF